MLLLDTHVLIWLAEGLGDLSLHSRKIIDEAAFTEGIAVSSISFWEIAMLSLRGRISLSQPVLEWRRRVIAAPGITESPVTGEVGIESVLLPGKLHEDPVDRILVATARLNEWRLATRDRRLLRYGASGHVRTLRI
jgi:PIN domain nuclease of toxin-antitoxin system